MTKRIAIMGSGANGSAIGADLVRAGLDVKLIDQWPAHVEAMRANGVTIRLPDETITTPVDAYHLCDIATFTEPFDVVLMLFKAYDTRWAAELIKPHLAEDGLLIGVQNGMTTETISDVVGPERTLGCVIELASELAEPGVVIRRSPPEQGSWFALGSVDPATAGREVEIADILKHVGVVEISPDILSSKWMKLVMNSMTLATAALLGSGLNESYAIPGMRDLMLKAGGEALAAGAAQDHKPVPIVGLEQSEIENTNHLLEVLIEKLESFTLPNTPTTVLQDHTKGRMSETDGINGLVAEILAEAGQAAPASAAIAEVTRQIHAGEIEPGPSNMDLIRKLVAI
ncbi:MAG: 2-dehydropantoate 2-reductase [Rhodospirillaceae bacterium]|jgi:2-dehydropantoate 2-reductase|nr:2-dehydropantoate 2-reductase [Rhodospirillaceae bacterium]MBT3929849.1 2-dehydropantoate 2-reductase [Rhodospirillaceae bacterium]MBT4771078.1 2-dehydropantoate 2-reductase [Rhodospirillaceae bacterium]MBT5357703.1 2-dehydropantoate 2-reductase [Rhodospirillaceae bacterium]MBT5768865.1 2-dehydropantoate 2-reductase [Rhodospirillaceae bacterium]